MNSTISALHLEQGDTLVLSYPGHLTADAVESLRDRIREQLGDVKVLVLSQGLALSVVRQVA